MWKSRPIPLAVIGLGCLLTCPPPISGADYYVTLLNDDYNVCALGGCSLREAIRAANGNGEIDTKKSRCQLAMKAQVSA